MCFGLNFSGGKRINQTTLDARLLLEYTNSTLVEITVTVSITVLLKKTHL